MERFEHFFPRLNEVIKVYEKHNHLEVNDEDKKKISKFQNDMNNNMLYLCFFWTGVLAFDFKRFFLKNYPLIIKIGRMKFHLMNGFFLLSIYTLLDYYKGYETINILNKYDNRFRSLLNNP